MNAVIIGIPVSTETYSCKFAFDAVSDARRRTALVTDVWAILSLQVNHEMALVMQLDNPTSAI